MGTRCDQRQRTAARWAVAIAAATVAGGCAVERDLIVQSKPAGAAVTVNGAAVGATPYRGKHAWADEKAPVVVTVAKPEHQSASRTFTRADAAATKGALTWTAELPPLTQAEQVTIDSTAEQATVKINGQTVGRTPVTLRLTYARADAAAAWSTYAVSVEKERHQYDPGDGAAPRPAYTATLGPGTAPSGRLVAKLDPVRYYTSVVRRFALTPEGVGVESEQATSQVGEIEREPKAAAVTQITDQPAWEPLVETRLSVAPDGRTVAYAVPLWEKGKDKPVGANIWLRTGAGLTRMTDGPFFDVEPSLSADGKWVYFSSNRLGRMTLWRVATTGRGGLQKVTDSPSAVVDYEPTLSPDGSRLAYSSMVGASRATQVWFCNPDGTLPTQVREGRSPAWSPDGRRVAYVARDGLSKMDAIWVMDADGSNPTRLTSPDVNSRHPSFMPDGRIVYASDRGLNDAGRRNFDVWVMDADGSAATQLTTNGSYDARPAVGGDAKHLYFLSNRGARREGEDTLQVWRLTF